MHDISIINQDQIVINTHIESNLSNHQIFNPLETITENSFEFMKHRYSFNYLKSFTNGL